MLQDHFHPPLYLCRHWQAFWNAWATYLASDLNHRLPQGYFAEANVQFGIEIDVAAFDERPVSRGGSSSVATAVWTAPPPTQTIPIALLPDAVEVLVYNQEAGPTSPRRSSS